MNYTDINLRRIDRWVEEGWEWGNTHTSRNVYDAKNGKWDVVLTLRSPCLGLVPDMKGITVLGLASGGGQQMPVFAALGAECTVLDYSVRQLENEKLVAEREGYNINLIRADIDTAAAL